MAKKFLAEDIDHSQLTDFVMELLSLGNDVKVLQPASLIDKIKAAHKAAYELY